MNDKTEVWIRVDGALSPKFDVETSFVIASPYPDAVEALRFAKALADEHGTELQIYGRPCESIRGQRQVQRWLYAHELSGYGWVTHIQEPPEGAEVIDKWPMSSKTASETTESLPKVDGKSD